MRFQAGTRDQAQHYVDAPADSTLVNARLQVECNGVQTVSNAALSGSSEGLSPYNTFVANASG